jgi:putative glutamine amidotransferase
VQLVADSHLATIMQTTDVQVESWHHQAVRSLPTGWRAAAYAADGLVEALERVDHPWMIAVQWHPELSPQDPAHQHIFRALIQAALKADR